VRERTFGFCLGVGLLGWEMLVYGLRVDKVPWSSTALTVRDSTRTAEDRLASNSMILPHVIAGACSMSTSGK